MVTAKDIHSGRIDYSTSRHTSWHAYHNNLTNKSRPRINDILLTKDGSIGRVALCDTDNICINQSIALIRPNDRVVPRFLRYLLETPHYQRRMEGDAEGTTIKHIYITRVDKMEVAVPSLAEQRAIAHILGTLDDKIELNRKMNETLEGIARAIFKSWFVDFEPVRAKAEGRQPVGMDADTAALFPDSFQDSELGKIPKGWEINPLPRAIDFLEGPGIRNWQYTNGSEGARFINIRCIKNGDLTLETANRVKDEEAYGKYAHFLLQPDDLVVSTSGTLGRYALVREEHLPLMLNTSVIRMRPINHFCSLSYLLGYVGTGLQEELEARASGSVQRNFGPMHLKQITMLTPPPKVLAAHSRASDCMHRNRQQNLKESYTLAAIRDALLPKLLSGEIRVDDAEEMVDNLQTDSIEHEQLKPTKNTPPQVETESEKQATSTIPIDELETDEVMMAFRQATRGRGAMTRHELIKQVSLRLGYQRLGTKIEHSLRNHLRAAIRRKIIGAEGDLVFAATSAIREYTHEDIHHVLRSVMRRGTSYERADVIAAVARHLGFQRLTQNIEHEIKRSINSAIRHGVLGYEGKWIWREE